VTEESPARTGLLASLSGLQKLCLALAAAISLSGAGLWGVGATTKPDRPETPANATTESATPETDPAFAPNSLTDDTTSRSNKREETTEGDTTPDADKSLLELYSPTIFRLGFGFFLGFAVAFALRAAFKIVLLVVGTVFLLLIGLQMAGLISVNWDAMQGIYDTSTTWLGTQTQSLTAFLRGYIPSGGSAVAGFGIGMLKKH